MNAHQRKKFATWKHYTMPLGCEVIVRLYRTHCVNGKMVDSFHPAIMRKHDRRNACIVEFTDGTTGHCGDKKSSWVTLVCVRPVKRNRVRPWWRVQNDKARNHRGA